MVLIGACNPMACPIQAVAPTASVVTPKKATLAVEEKPPENLFGVSPSVRFERV